MATSPMEDFFNLPPSAPAIEVVTLKSKEELMTDAREVYSALTTAEKVDFALPAVVGLDTFDTEMDAISVKAEQTFQDLISLGSNVPDMHAGKIFEVAGQMLKTSLDAKIAKADKKLKMIELQLKKVRSEQVDFELGNGQGKAPNGAEFDRNELLRFIVNSKKSVNSDK